MDYVQCTKQCPRPSVVNALENVNRLNEYSVTHIENTKIGHLSTQQVGKAMRWAPSKEQTAGETSCRTTKLYSKISRKLPSYFHVSSYTNNVFRAESLGVRKPWFPPELRVCARGHTLRQQSGSSASGN